MNKKTQGGFTLVEILVVVAIIGVLTGLVTVNLQDARLRARDTQRKSDIRAVRQALELYKDDKRPQTYPPTDAYLTEITAGKYMKELPHDPIANSGWPDYIYELDSSDSLKYTLTTCLENKADQDKDAVNICAKGVSYTITEP